MPLPLVTITGNLTTDPELRFTASGVAVVNMRVASSERKRQADGTYADGDSTFVNVTAWRELAEHVAESLTKGDRVVVTGRLHQSSYEKDGQKRTALDVHADEVGVALTFAIARPSRASASRSQSAPSDDPWAPRNDQAPF